ncbi:MAG: hypothetical protein VYD35_03605, partial [Actinomycetota bacterium]|nr:hypothetical protein [Actinomycetota bacterium]
LSVKRSDQALIAIGTFIATLITAPRVDRGVILGLLLSFFGYLVHRSKNRKILKSKDEPPVSR